MPRKRVFDLDPDGSIQWPNRCPLCSSTRNMAWVDAHVSHTETSYRVIYVRSTTESTNLSLPICGRHASKFRLGVALTRKSRFSSFVRKTAYFFSALGLCTLFTSATAPDTGEDALYFKLFCMAAMLYTGVVFWFKRWMPLRLLSLYGSRIRLQISSPSYARDFALANRGLILPKRPWYDRNDWGTIIVGVLMIAWAIKTAIHPG